jgi:hypothetical protein
LGGDHRPVPGVAAAGWWRAYGVGDDSYVGFETEATGILDFTLTYIAGLLQTAEYCRALLQTGLRRRTRQQLTDAVAVRTIRQLRLTSAEHPLTLTAVIDENALHRTIGGPRLQAASRCGQSPALGTRPSKGGLELRTSHRAGASGRQEAYLTPRQLRLRPAQPNGSVFRPIASGSEVLESRSTPLRNRTSERRHQNAKALSPLTPNSGGLIMSRHEVESNRSRLRAVKDSRHRSELQLAIFNHDVRRIYRAPGEDVLLARCPPHRIDGGEVVLEVEWSCWSSRRR